MKKKTVIEQAVCWIVKIVKSDTNKNKSTNGQVQRGGARQAEVEPAGVPAAFEIDQGHHAEVPPVRGQEEADGRRPGPVQLETQHRHHHQVGVLIKILTRFAVL